MKWRRNSASTRPPEYITLFVWLRAWDSEPRQVDLGWWSGGWTVTKRDEVCDEDVTHWAIPTDPMRYPKPVGNAHRALREASLVTLAELESMIRRGDDRDYNTGD